VIVDSNAAQFERLGNPWISERDRREMPTYAGRKVKRVAPRLAEALGKFPTERPIGKPRAESAGLGEYRRATAFLTLFKSGLPGGTRTVASRVDPPAPLVNHYSTLAEAQPLTNEQMRLRAEQRAAEQARLAEVARLEAERLAEKRAEERRREFADFAAAMSAALA
jgi:hypothetical protein